MIKKVQQLIFGNELETLVDCDLVMTSNKNIRNVGFIENYYVYIWGFINWGHKFKEENMDICLNLAFESINNYNM